MNESFFMEKLSLLFLSLLLSSCSNSIGATGTIGIIALFALLILASSAMYLYVLKKKRKSNNSLDSFSADVHNMLLRIKNPADKISALKQLIVRIESDEKYQKTPDWRDSVLSKVYEHLAAVYYSMGEEKGVIEACSKVIELDPSNGMSYYNRGSIYNNLGEYEKALKDFNDAILLLPEYSNVYNNRGLVFDKLERYEEALSDFDYAIQLEPSAITYYNRANLYYEQNEYEKAKQDYITYLELDPEDFHKLRTYVESALQLINDKKQKDRS